MLDERVSLFEHCITFAIVTTISIECYSIFHLDFLSPFEYGINCFACLHLKCWLAFHHDSCICALSSKIQWNKQEWNAVTLTVSTWKSTCERENHRWLHQLQPSSTRHRKNAMLFLLLLLNATFLWVMPIFNSYNFSKWICTAQVVAQLEIYGFAFKWCKLSE